MKRFHPLVLAGWLAVSAGAAAAELPGRFAGENIVVGLEYALLDSERAVVAKAPVWAETGLTGMKPLGESTAWERMQAGPERPIVFDRLDWFVREYQRNGFTDLTVALKPHSRWGSKDVKLLKARNATPKPEYLPQFERWVGSVVERYDGDGVDDMPGLRWPVHTYEIGTELSSYEPEPIDQYLEMLAVAYRAAHRAFPGVRIAHSAFLTTPVDLDVDDPADYERAWRETKRHDEHHGLASQRAVLDRPELFDLINLHNLGAPTEIEDQMRWLDWETGRRGYSKPVIVSDTLPTPYVAWGPATTCEGRVLGVLVPPATEADRCRLAAYFTKLVEKDAETLAWTRGFVAADHVQRTIVAAEQGIERINLSFVSDLPFLTGKLARAGAGISAWGGAVRQQPRSGRILERYPLFRAIRQMMGHLHGYRSIERLERADPKARIYRIEGAAGPFWVAWRDPRAVLLPEDGEPALETELDVGAPRALLEPAITEMGRSEPLGRNVETTEGRLTLRLVHRPVYVFPRRH